MPQRHKRVGFASAESGPEAERQAGFLRIRQFGKYGFYDISMTLDRVSIREELFGVSINVGRENGVVQFALADFNAWLAAPKNAHIVGRFPSAAGSPMQSLRERSFFNCPGQVVASLISWMCGMDGNKPSMAVPRQ